jgi:hypothetical protein
MARYCYFFWNSSVISVQNLRTHLDTDRDRHDTGLSFSGLRRNRGMTDRAARGRISGHRGYFFKV